MVRICAHRGHLQRPERCGRRHFLHLHVARPPPRRGYFRLRRGRTGYSKVDDDSKLHARNRVPDSPTIDHCPRDLRCIGLDLRRMRRITLPRRNAKSIILASTHMPCTVLGGVNGAENQNNLSAHVHTAGDSFVRRWTSICVWCSSDHDDPFPHKCNGYKCNS